jgi:glycosyltransferase involved in cell wall biosynthesis
MRVAVVLEHRFSRTPDGKVWTPSTCVRRFWERYLEVFDRVCVVARIQQVAFPPPGAQRADGSGIEFSDVPYYLGPWQYVWRRRKVIRAVRAAVASSDAVILRVPSLLGGVLQPLLLGRGQPYAVEVVGDPRDVFSKGANSHPLRPFFRYWSPRRLRNICQGACAASYVTGQALQRRYPPFPGVEAVGCSDVDLPEDSFADAPRLAGIHKEGARTRLITVGSLGQLYKAPDVLIDSLALCVAGGLDVELVLVGDGKHRRELQARASDSGLEERVFFKGQLSSGVEVRKELDQADLFVLASYQEGLPRAMIEAMARGLPCIGSTVGGIPELLSEEYLVPPGDAGLLAGKIKELLGNRADLAIVSATNLKKAEGYAAGVLQKKRVNFYRQVQERTDSWLARRK